MNAPLRGLLKSRSTLYVGAALIVGVLGGKMLWVDSGPVINVPIASSKPAVKKSTTKPAAARTKAPAAVEQPASSVAQDEAPAAALDRTAFAPSAAPRRAQPAGVDSSSDTDDLFLIAALHDGQRAEAPLPQPAPVPAPAGVGDITNNALAERVVTSATPQGNVTEGLGPVFADDTNGYFIRFPAGWSIRRFDSEPWVVECGDGRGALISVGFSAFPAEFTADNVPLEWVARRIRKRPDTALNAQGYATIMGRKAIWSKSTGPMLMGNKQVKVVRTTYLLPLGDGRVAEIRIAAAPEQFEKIAGLMKNSVSTFRLVSRKGAAGQNMAKIE